MTTKSLAKACKVLRNRGYVRLFLGRKLLKEVHLEISKFQVVGEKPVGGKKRPLPDTVKRSLRYTLYSNPAHTTVKETVWTGWYPWHKLPNCSKFEIEKGQMNEWLLSLGVKKRINRKLKFTPGPNKAMLKYAKSRIMRLRGAILRWDYNLAMHLFKLICKSKVFNLMALQHIMPTWYKHMSIREVCTTIYHSMEIAFNPWNPLKRQPHYFGGMPYESIYQLDRVHNQPKRDNITPIRIDYARFYIAKSNGKLRPLGVPILAWRLHMCLLNWVLYEYCYQFFPTWQHGYKPADGVRKCWKEILKSVTGKKYSHVYEFDIKGFFPNVNPPRALGEMCKERIIPWELGNWLLMLSNSWPKINLSVARQSGMDRVYTNLDDQLKALAVKSEDVTGTAKVPFWTLAGKWQNQQVTDPSFYTFAYWAEWFKTNVLVPKIPSVKTSLLTEEEIEYLSAGYMTGKLPDERWKALYFKWFNKEHPPEALFANVSEKRDSELLYPFYFKRNLAHFTDIRRMGETGFPQGAAYSPLVSVMYLRDLGDKMKLLGHKLIMYADDGVVFTNDPIACQDDLKRLLSELWLELAEDKCKASPVDDLNLSFLGVKLTIRTNPRNEISALPWWDLQSAFIPKEQFQRYKKRTEILWERKTVRLEANARDKVTLKGIIKLGSKMELDKEFSSKLEFITRPDDVIRGKGTLINPYTSDFNHEAYFRDVTAVVSEDGTADYREYYESKEESLEGYLKRPLESLLERGSFPANLDVGNSWESAKLLDQTLDWWEHQTPRFLSDETVTISELLKRKIGDFVFAGLWNDSFNPENTPFPRELDDGSLRVPLNKRSVAANLLGKSRKESKSQLEKSLWLYRKPEKPKIDLYNASTYSVKAALSILTKHVGLMRVNDLLRKKKISIAEWMHHRKLMGITDNNRGCLRYARGTDGFHLQLSWSKPRGRPKKQ